MDTGAEVEEIPIMEKGPDPQEDNSKNPDMVSEQLTSSKTSLHDSEYESVESGDNYSADEDERHHHTGDSGHSGSESGSVILEREEGDGQESIPARKVDDDQDKKNPQYIPKRGTFYEHDDRTADDVDNPEAAEAEKTDKDGKKKVWQDKKEKWSHDKFNDDDQAPKSRQELISIYGYDIRNEDGPPRARRRRRYGRGPNKYTRNWEDEDAYNKPPVAIKKKGPKNPRSRNQTSETDSQEGSTDLQQEEVGTPQTPNARSQPKRPENNERSSSPLDNEDTQQETNHSEEDAPRVEAHNNRNQSHLRGSANKGKPTDRRFAKDNYEHERELRKPLHFNNSNMRQQKNFPRNNMNSERIDNFEQQPSTNRQERQENYQQESNYRNNPQVDRYNNKNQSRVGTGRIVKPQRDIKDSDYRGFTRARQFKNSRPESQVTPPRNDRRHERQEYVQSQNYSNKNMQQNVQEIERDMGKLNVHDGSYNRNKHNNANNQRQASVPPRLQAEQKGSKRYSSIRQRSLPETANPPLSLPLPQFYTNEYGQQPGQQPPLLQHPGPPLHPPAQMPQIAPPPLAPIPQQVPPTTTTILQAPPQYAAPFAQPPPQFLQPAVAPPPFIAQQTPQIINYVQSQPPYPQAPFPEYQQQFNPVTQPAELYTPSPGITYYNPQQQSTQRPAPQKRPKAAIPIVAPPPLEPRGRGRANQAEMSSPNNGSENNMESNATPPEEPSNFEDAAVTVQQ